MDGVGFKLCVGSVVVVAGGGTCGWNDGGNVDDRCGGVLLVSYVVGPSRPLSEPCLLWLLRQELERLFFRQESVYSSRWPTIFVYTIRFTHI